MIKVAIELYISTVNLYRNQRLRMTLNHAQCISLIYISNMITFYNAVASIVIVTIDLYVFCLFITRWFCIKTYYIAQLHIGISIPGSRIPGLAML